MTSPVITTRRERGRPEGRRPCRPDWSAVADGTCSNTYGNGAAVRPVPAGMAAQRRPARTGERTFERAGWWWRARRRAGLVLTSPGMVLVGGATSVLLLGLSPWLTDPGTASGPVSGPVPGAATATTSFAVSSAGSTTGAVGGAVGQGN